jgi:3-oxoacyl-[acyl-carrier protein] reductase
MTGPFRGRKPTGVDRYQRFVSRRVGRALARRTGLPQPTVLRRYADGDPVLPGPALLCSLAGSRLPLGAVLAGAGVTVQTADDGQTRYAGVVVDASAVSTVAGLADLRGALAPVLRRIAPSGRIVLIGTAPAPADGPEPAAARQAIEGVVRSLAKELRAGATANLLRLTAPEIAPAALESTLRFFLSGRSAYVDGQVIDLGTGSAPAPADWDRPAAGSVALVTGAARGIGAAIARTLARDGATVICADLPAAGEALAGVANEIGGSTFAVDIAAPEAAERLGRHLTDRFGGVDVVVHNAGITRDKLLANMKPDAWAAVLAVNLQAQLRLNDMLLAGVLRPGGRVVCLSSTSGIAGNRGQTNYAASKAGVIGMVRATAPLLAPTGGTINAIAPGFIDTDMTRAMPFGTRQVAQRLNSLQQAGLPVDVAETAAWLSSSGAGAVNGQVLRVCGQNLVGA